MPTYEYRCAACGQEFEKFQRMSDEPVAECPNCGANAERRLSGGAGLIFKGSGFYITDYRSDSYKKDAGIEGGSKSGDGGKKGGGSEKSDTSASSPASSKKGGSEKSSSSDVKSSSTPKAD